MEIAPVDLDALYDVMRHASKPHLRIKATALWNLGRGKSRQQVAEFLGVSKASISAWSTRFREHGMAGLAIQAGRGRRPQVDMLELEQCLRQSPRVFGVPQTRWTLRALRDAVPSLRGLTEMGVWKALQRAGFRYKRGQPQLHSPDPEYGEKRGGWNRRSGKQWPIPGKS